MTLSNMLSDGQILPRTFRSLMSWADRLAAR